MILLCKTSAAPNPRRLGLGFFTLPQLAAE